MDMLELLLIWYGGIGIGMALVLAIWLNWLVKQFEPKKRTFPNFLKGKFGVG